MQVTFSRGSRRTRPFGLVLLLLLLAGCAVSGQMVDLSEVTVREGFDERALKGGVAILGFHFAATDLPAGDRDQLDYPLFQALQAHLPQVSVTGAKTVRARLADAGVHDLATAAFVSGRLHELPYAQLRERLAPRRLLLWAHLESHVVVKTDASDDDSVAYCSTRAIRVRYRLVDMAAQAPLWEGVVARQDQDCRSNPRSNTRGAKGRGILAAALVDVLTDTLTDSVFGTYPEPPSLGALAAQASRDLASQLPGAATERRKPTTATADRLTQTHATAR
jgi:hypothetical protein